MPKKKQNSQNNDILNLFYIWSQSRIYPINTKIWNILTDTLKFILLHFKRHSDDKTFKINDRSLTIAGYFSFPRYPFPVFQYF